MITYEDNIYLGRIEKDLKIDCKDCFGFCCVALYFSKCDGFPNDKEAGKPCNNLNKDFTCKVHNNLRNKGLKGCTIYDCFGAGQKVAQITYANENWIDNHKLKNEMFEAFLVMRNLHEMMWYLKCALENKYTKSLYTNIKETLDETIRLTNLSAKELLNVDVDSHRSKVNDLLKKSSELIISKYMETNKKHSKGKKSLNRGFDFIGKDLRNYNLIGADFKGSLLIAADISNTNLKGANFIGADLRDANLCGADLSDSVFVTQIQVNSAKGDSKTILPKNIDRPSYWEK